MGKITESAAWVAGAFGTAQARYRLRTLGSMWATVSPIPTISTHWLPEHKRTRLSAQWSYVVVFPIKYLRVFESPYASGLMTVSRRGEMPG